MQPPAHADTVSVHERHYFIHNMRRRAAPQMPKSASDASFTHGARQVIGKTRGNSVRKLYREKKKPRERPELTSAEVAPPVGGRFQASARCLVNTSM